MKVLVPVDGSECALRAVEYLMKKRVFYGDPAQQEIHLLNVQHPMPGDVDMFVSHDEIKRFHHDEGIKALQGARKLLDEAGANYRFHISVGDSAEIIVEFSKKLGVDKILMGTHGRGTVAGLLMGSTTRKVLHLTTVPVELVR